MTSHVGKTHRPERASATVVRHIASTLRGHSELLSLIAQLGRDERRVLCALAKRLLVGQRGYGRLDIAADARDWRTERAEELADALIYTAIAECAGQLRGDL